MNYFFIVLGVLALVGVGALTLNNHNETVTDAEPTTSAETVTPETSAEATETEDYTIDPSDMYTVAETNSEATPSLVTADEERWLVLMREEEKLARDVYHTLGEQWGLQIFSNIASSEQTHTDAVKVLLERYGIDDPVTDDTVGVFTDPEMQQLYDDLTAQGGASLLAALVVGATIEDLDINDLDQAMAATTKEDIVLVYQNLQKGSRNHLRAFVRQIERNGGTYTPQYISVANYEETIASLQERGRIE